MDIKVNCVLHVWEFDTRLEVGMIVGNVLKEPMFNFPCEVSMTLFSFNAKNVIYLSSFVDSN